MKHFNRDWIERVIKSASKKPRSMMPQLGFFFLALSLCVCFTGCDWMTPGPISVTAEISPTTVTSGSSIKLTVTVKNSGGKVTIKKINVKEEIISGWAKGKSAEKNMPVTFSEIDLNGQVAYTMTAIAYNTGYTNIGVKDTITVFSDGGDDSASVTYTIISAYNSTTYAPSGSATGLIQTAER